jgi:uroporphyrinogen-III decarboxylase
MVFDSWAGELGPASFSEFSEPYLARISQKLPEKLDSLSLERVPMTVFPKGAWHALDKACNLGYDVVGLDWMQDPADAVKVRGDRNITFQGNADPGVLYGTKEAITAAVERMVEGFWVGNKGWIANLGHGKILSIRVLGPTFLKKLTKKISRHHSWSRPRQPEALLRRGTPSDQEISIGVYRMGWINVTSSAIMRIDTEQ